MYVGKVNVSQENLKSLIKAAESLKIIGLGAFVKRVLKNQETTMRTKNNVNIGNNDLLPNAKRKTRK